MNLMLFTTSYPYIRGGEQNFVEMEAAHLLRSFVRVVIVPEKSSDQRQTTLPGMEVEDGYASYLQSHSSLSRVTHGLVSGLVWHEIARKPWILSRPQYLKRLIFSAGHAVLTRDWLVRWIRAQHVDGHDWLLYSYWFTEVTLGLGLAKRSIPGVKLVTRAHRYDLYEEANTPPYWPCREMALEDVDRVFPVSDDGTRYLLKRYPKFHSKIETARLGIQAQPIRSSASSDQVCRIVSCSKLVPVKRIDLLMRGIAAAAARRPLQRFEWNHIGVGPLQKEVEAWLRDLPANVTACLLEYTNQAGVLEYYRTHPVDVFLNVSASEGTPVTIMEAASCGIPIIATAVGGNAEIVSRENGTLLEPDPSPAEIADALLSQLDDPAHKRDGSVAIWAREYDAGRNYPAFVGRLVNIRSQN